MNLRRQMLLLKGGPMFFVGSSFATLHFLSSKAHRCSSPASINVIRDTRGPACRRRTAGGMNAVLGNTEYSRTRHRVCICNSDCCSAGGRGAGRRDVPEVADALTHQHGRRSVPSPLIETTRDPTIGMLVTSEGRIMSRRRGRRNPDRRPGPLEALSVSDSYHHQPVRGVDEGRDGGGGTSPGSRNRRGVYRDPRERAIGRVDPHDDVPEGLSRGEGDHRGMGCCLAGEGRTILMDRSPAWIDRGPPGHLVVGES